jgi:hypothetical protein
MFRKSLLFLVIALAAFVLGGFVIYQVLEQRERQYQRTEATVLLEQVRQVCQLVTVEGRLTEIYDQRNFREMTLYLPLPATFRFEKSALLQLTGKVLVGYDLAAMRVDIDSIEQVVYLSNLPEPSILAIDHEVAYRNLEESFFNSFSPEDYTQLNRNAKNVLRQKAYESGLIEEAAAEGNAVIESIRYMVNAMGYRLEITPQSLPAATPPPDR